MKDKEVKSLERKDKTEVEGKEQQHEPTGVEEIDPSTDEGNPSFTDRDEGHTLEEGEIHSLQVQLEEERKKAEDYYQKYLRSQADFDNYRKRMMKEREELTKYGVKPLLEKLLPAVDNLERAIQSAKTEENGNLESFIQGVEMVYRQIMDAMKAEGAVPLETVGKPFDPYFHQAIMQVETGEEKGIVVEEFQKGYMLKDKLIRPAMVKVSS